MRPWAGEESGESDVKTRTGHAPPAFGFVSLLCGLREEHSTQMNAGSTSVWGERRYCDTTVVSSRPATSRNVDTEVGGGGLSDIRNPRLLVGSAVRTVRSSPIRRRVFAGWDLYIRRSVIKSSLRMLSSIAQSLTHSQTPKHKFIIMGLVDNLK